MAYTVDTAEPVEAYLRTVSGLSREGRLKLFAGFLSALRERGDELRLEPSARSPAIPGVPGREEACRVLVDWLAATAVDYTDNTEG